MLPIYRLDSIGTAFLPIEEVVIDELTTLLKSRILLVNNCVIRIYKEELCLSQRLQHLRKVFLFEASDLMYSFYSNLFQQVSSCFVVVFFFIILLEKSTQFLDSITQSVVCHVAPRFCPMS